MSAQTNELNWPACRCGCGQPVAAATKTDSSRNLIVGSPLQYASVACRYRPRAVVDGAPCICKECKVLTPLHDMVRNKGCPSGYGRFCRFCDQSKRRARIASRRPNEYNEQRGKLPPYDELKALYLGTKDKKGLTYAQIAEKYNCAKGSVQFTLRNRARRRNEWPLLSPQENERRRLARIQATKKSVPSFGLRFTILEYMEEKGLTRHEFCDQHNLDFRYISKLLNKNGQVSVHMAIRILEACDEAVRPDLREAAAKYRPTTRIASVVPILQG